MCEISKEQYNEIKEIREYLDEMFRLDLEDFIKRIEEKIRLEKERLMIR